MTIESIRCTVAIQFGGYVQNTIVRGQNQAAFSAEENGILVSYVLKNANTGEMYPRSTLVPWSNILAVNYDASTSKKTEVEQNQARTSSDTEDVSGRGTVGYSAGQKSIDSRPASQNSRPANK